MITMMTMMMMMKKKLPRLQQQNSKKEENQYNVPQVERKKHQKHVMAVIGNSTSNKHQNLPLASLKP